MDNECVPAGCGPMWAYEGFSLCYVQVLFSLVYGSKNAVAITVSLHYIVSTEWIRKAWAELLMY